MSAAATSPVENLEPKPVWQLFSGIAAVPRESKHEEQIRAYMKKLVTDRGLKVREDKVGNLLVEVPASPGCEAAPITILQGHLDMVCEQNTGGKHDFRKDPIRMVLATDAKGEQILRADGTTLGSDNGIGVAMSLAAAFSPDVKHGPLELLFTIDEEAGMTGAKALEQGFFRGRRMINLDSEEDDALYIGCAGGSDATLTRSYSAAPLDDAAEAARVAITGLRGGHSGGEIHENRGNAIKLLARTLHAVEERGVRIAEFGGGSKRNVIPREATATMVCQRGGMEALRTAAKTFTAAAQAESGEQNVQIAVEPVGLANLKGALSANDTQALLAMLLALPSGVIGMHPRVPGLVQTSNNLATMAIDSSRNGRLHAEIGLLARSSSPEWMQAVLTQIAAVARLGGAEFSAGNSYPGWEPNLDSPLLNTCQTLYERMFKAAPRVTAIHAGLECGLIGERVGGGLDMISFGPRINGAHSPDERVWVASVEKIWKYLQAVLAELAKP